MSQKRRRITAKRKQEIVLRLLNGEALDVLSRERLLELTHQDLSDAFDRSIDAHISRLRSKLGDNLALYEKSDTLK